MKFFIIEFILFKIDNLYSGSVLDLLFKNDQNFSPILKMEKMSCKRWCCQIIIFQGRTQNKTLGPIMVQGFINMVQGF